MSLATALPEAQQLKQALLDHGVPEVSIELQIGRPSPYEDDWNCQFVVCNFTHHIVSRYSPSNPTPGLHTIKNGRGRPGDSNYLPGPLANGYGGFDLCARIITLGYANHPGAGGPITVAGGYTIPKDSARRYAFGWEFEGGLSEADWDRVYTNPRNSKSMTFREFMGRCGAGIQDKYNLPLAAHLEHSTWTTRKIDRLNYTQKSGIAEIDRYNDIKTDPIDERLRNSSGQLSMSYKAIIKSLDEEVTGNEQKWRDAMWGTMTALGLCSRPTTWKQPEFRYDYITATRKLNATAYAYSFEYLCDRAGYWPPDTNDWPANAWNHRTNTRM